MKNPPEKYLEALTDGNLFNGLNTTKMKLFYDLSNLEKSTTFKHDAQLIKGVQIGIIVFLILSSITVFGGLKSHLSDHLLNTFFLWRWLILGSSYLFGALGIDLVNTVCLGYVISAILRKDFERESIILIVFCSVLSLGLTHYSFSMSQNSAVAIGNDLKEEKQKDDTKDLNQINTTLSDQLKTIEENYTINHQRIMEPFTIRIDNISKSFDNQISILKNEIAVIDQNSTKENYLYAAKQKRPLTAKIGQLEDSKLQSVKPILKEQQTALDKLTDEKSQMITDAKNVHQSDRKRKQHKTDSVNAQVNTTSTVFSNLFSRLSGFAVFGLLILTATKEVLYFKNNIEPTPILSNFDFSPSWTMEVLFYPMVWVRRHSVNQVRNWYGQLPALQQPVIQDKIYDGRSLGQTIVSFDPSNDSSRSAPGYMPPGQSRNLETKDQIYTSTVATETGKSVDSNTGSSQYSHETPSFGGVDDLLETAEPTNTTTHEKSDEPTKKIKHIGKNEKVYWYDQKQVMGKVKKYTANVREWQKKASRKKATSRDKTALINNKELLIYWQGRITEF